MALRRNERMIVHFAAPEFLAMLGAEIGRLREIPSSASVA
jgi:hypothetical protein